MQFSYLCNFDFLYQCTQLRRATVCIFIITWWSNKHRYNIYVILNGSVHMYLKSFICIWSLFNFYFKQNRFVSKFIYPRVAPKVEVRTNFVWKGTWPFVIFGIIHVIKLLLQTEVKLPAIKLWCCRPIHRTHNRTVYIDLNNICT